jgi:biopolymer transport protein ExbD
MRMGPHGEEEEDDGEHGIDLAPMLDFVLNLLIFFIVTAAFTSELGLGLSSPPPSNNNQPQKENTSLVIIIQDNGDLAIDGRLIDPGAVMANVERFHALKPEGPVIVVPSEKAPTGVMVRVMDDVRLGGVTNVSVASPDGA